MGTRRSRHNRGRKPLYKEHGNDSVRHGEEPTAPKVKLVPEVRNFMPRKTIIWDDGKRKAATNEPRVIALPPSVDDETCADLLADALEAGRTIKLSQHDLLLHLYAERKIDNTLLRAGHLWQHHMEMSSIQRCISIDPSAPNYIQHWQKDGDLSESQHLALVKRKMVSGALGARGVKFLDLVLGPDVGRSEAMRLTHMNGNQLFHVLSWLLNGLAIYYGYRSNYSHEYEEFAACCDAREKYESTVSRARANVTVSGLQRKLNNEDTDVIGSWG